ncbi:hypothetical protein [Rufibacter immobilis]|nr:hypothetical protein [Rufibacter immobilis]
MLKYSFLLRHKYAKFMLAALATFFIFQFGKRVGEFLYYVMN